MLDTIVVELTSGREIRISSDLGEFRDVGPDSPFTAQVFTRSLAGNITGYYLRQTNDALKCGSASSRLTASGKNAQDYAQARALLQSFKDTRVDDSYVLRALLKMILKRLFPGEEF